MVQMLHSVAQAADWLAARVRPQGAPVLRTDSRSVRAGEAFIAWPGYAQDGRGFVAQALAAGAATCLVEADGVEAFGFTDARVASLPGVPTIAEQGLPAYELDGWIAPVAPSGLPKTELARLYNAFKAAMEMPEARDALVAQGYEIKLTPPDAAAASCDDCRLAAESLHVAVLCHTRFS